ncbi:MAG TPA: hypothetical protein VFU23_11900 [Gemmatimonadales bacterium]|nr:hypothetical protein [Gemmatimonadales bacterium]
MDPQAERPAFALTEAQQQRRAEVRALQGLGGHPIAAAGGDALAPRIYEGTS